MKKNKETQAEESKAIDVLYDKETKTYRIIKVKYTLDEVNKDDILIVGSNQAMADLELRKFIAGKFLKFGRGE